MPERSRLLHKDAHNQRLVDNVHPSSWVDPDPAPICEEYREAYASSAFFIYARV